MNLMMKEWADKAWVKQFSNDTDGINKVKPNNISNILKLIVKVWMLFIALLMMGVLIASCVASLSSADIPAAKELAKERLK
jgi:hypothetical protein